MRNRMVLALVLALALAALLAAGSFAEEAKATATAAAEAHRAFTPDALTWGEAPPALPAGAKVAVLQGDPTQAGPFTIRLSFPDGYRVAPHWHPTAENVTVVSGTMRFGMGDKVDEAGMQRLPAGGFVTMPAEMRHYATAEGATVVQVHGTGPFAITYVNPLDDPRSAPKP